MPRTFESFVVPADGGFRHAFFEEALRQPGISLHDLRERMPAIKRLAGLLEFADGFIEQAHLTEGDAQVVVRLGIFVGSSNIRFEILLEFAKHLGEIDSSVFAEWRRLRSGTVAAGAGGTGIIGGAVGATPTGADQATDAIGAGGATWAAAGGATGDTGATCCALEADAAALAAIGGATLGTETGVATGAGGTGLAAATGATG